MPDLKKPNKSTLRKGTPPKEEEASTNLEVIEKIVENSNANVPNVDKEDCKTLSFKVPNSFRKKFRIHAANNEITMTDLLIRSFEQYEQNQS